MAPSLYFDNKRENQNILWLGISGKFLKKLNSFDFIDFTLTAYPIDIGLQPIPKIRISDSISKNYYDFEEIAYVFVDKISVE